MSVAVILPPEPIVVPADIAGASALGDATVTALIAAAQEEIDGPSGWVGRCFGVQTLELRLCRFAADVILLPYPPLIDVASVKYDDAAGVEQTIEDTAWRSWNGQGVALRPGAVWPTSSGAEGSVRIQYRAGYEEDTTGKVPERARQAVILGVRALMGLVADGMLRSRTVEGVGARTFVGADIAAPALRQASERLLQTLRVYA